MASDSRATKQVEIVTCCVDDVDCEIDEAAAEADVEADAKAEAGAEAEAEAEAGAEEAGDKTVVSYIDYCPRYVDNIRRIINFSRIKRHNLQR